MDGTNIIIIQINKIVHYQQRYQLMAAILIPQTFSTLILLWGGQLNQTFCASNYEKLTQIITMQRNDA